MTADVHGYVGADYVVANGDTHVNGPCGSARDELQLTGRLVHEAGAGRKRRPSTGLVEVGGRSVCHGLRPRSVGTAVPPRCPSWARAVAGVADLRLAR